MITLLGTVLAKGRILSFLQCILGSSSSIIPQDCIPNIFGLTLYYAVIVTLLLKDLGQFPIQSAQILRACG